MSKYVRELGSPQQEWGLQKPLVPLEERLREKGFNIVEKLPVQPSLQNPPYAQPQQPTYEHQPQKPEGNYKPSKKPSKIQVAAATAALTISMLASIAFAACNPQTKTITHTENYTTTETYTQKETETLTKTVPSPPQTKTITDTIYSTQTITPPTQTITVTDPALTKTVTQTVGTYTQTETVTAPPQTTTITDIITKTIPSPTLTQTITETLTLPPATVTVTTAAPPVTTTKTITDTIYSTQTITQTNTQTVTKTVTPPVQISNLKEIIEQNQDRIIPGGTGTSVYEDKTFFGSSNVSIKNIFEQVAFDITGDNLGTTSWMWVNPKPTINAYILTPTEFKEKLHLQDENIVAYTLGSDAFLKGNNPLYVTLDYLSHEALGHIYNSYSNRTYYYDGTGDELEEVVASASEAAFMRLLEEKYGLTALKVHNDPENISNIQSHINFYKTNNSYSARGPLGLWLEAFRNPEWNAELVQNGKLSSNTLWGIAKYLMTNCVKLGWGGKYWTNLGGFTPEAEKNVMNILTSRLVSEQTPSRNFDTAILLP